MPTRRSRRAVARPAAVVAALLAMGLALVCGCDGENTCSIACPTGTRFTNDGTCACEPFDAGYCAVLGDCPDAYCPASPEAGACGTGQEWSTTLCGCYPLPATASSHPG